MKTIKFGRLVEFDERSRKFPIRALIPKEVKPRSYTWRCSTCLDQGSLPACVGFAVSHEAAARPVEVPGITNDIARQIYYRAQKLDDIPGEDYEGSSVLGGCYQMPGRTAGRLPAGPSCDNCSQQANSAGRRFLQ